MLDFRVNPGSPTREFCEANLSTFTRERTRLGAIKVAVNVPAGKVPTVETRTNSPIKLP